MVAGIAHSAQGGLVCTDGWVDEIRTEQKELFAGLPDPGPTLASWTRLTLLLITTFPPPQDLMYPPPPCSGVGGTPFTRQHVPDVRHWKSSCEVIVLESYVRSGSWLEGWRSERLASCPPREKHDLRGELGREWGGPQED